jgi:hypothetical protein
MLFQFPVEGTLIDDPDAHAASLDVREGD